MSSIVLIRENIVVFKYASYCERYHFVNHLKYKPIIDDYRSLKDGEYQLFVNKTNSTKQFKVVKKDTIIVFCKGLVPHLIYDLNDKYDPIPMIIRRGEEKVLSIYINNSNPQAIISAIYYLNMGLHNISYNVDSSVLVFYDSICVENLIVDKTTLLGYFCRSLDQEVQGYYQYGFDSIFEIMISDLLDN